MERDNSHHVLISEHGKLEADLGVVNGAHVGALPVEVQRIRLDTDEQPLNWPAAKKWLATIVVALMSAIVTFSSSMHAPAIGMLRLNKKRLYGGRRTMYSVFDIMSCQLILSQKPYLHR